MTSSHTKGYETEILFDLNLNQDKVPCKSLFNRTYCNLLQFTENLHFHDIITKTIVVFRKLLFGISSL